MIDIMLSVQIRCDTCGETLTHDPFNSDKKGALESSKRYFVSKGWRVEYGKDRAHGDSCVDCFKKELRSLKIFLG